MFVRSILSSYSRLLAGVSLAFLAVALAGCNDKVAEKPAPSRPVLVATAHYEAETPERSFVGTIKPRIETDMGFRVPGKVAKRLVEVGQTVEIGQPLATLDEVDLKLQAEQAEAEFTRRDRRAGAGRRRRDSAPRNCAPRAGPPMRRWIRPSAAADEARARLNRAERSVELTKNSLSYATLVADTRGVVTATLIEPGQVVAAGQTAIRVARFAEKEAVVAIPETLVGARQDRQPPRVTLWSEPNKKYAAKLREIAPTRRSRDAHLSRQILAARRRRQGLARHDRDADAVPIPRPSAWRGCRCRRCSTQGGKPSLYVVDDAGDVALKPVTVKSYESNDVVITGGVDEGAKVVALGVQKLDPAPEGAGRVVAVVLSRPSLRSDANTNPQLKLPDSSSSQ